MRSTLVNDRPSVPTTVKLSEVSGPHLAASDCPRAVMRAAAAARRAAGTWARLMCGAKSVKKAAAKNGVRVVMTAFRYERELELAPFAGIRESGRMGFDQRRHRSSLSRALQACSERGEGAGSAKTRALKGDSRRRLWSWGCEDRQPATFPLPPHDQHQNCPQR